MSPEDSSSKSGGIEIAIARHIEAPPEQVFDAWLDQGSVGRWLFATPGGVMKRVSIEPHVGGGFVISEDREGQVAEHRRHAHARGAGEMGGVCRAWP